MKVKLSQSDWLKIGTTAGWIKTASMTMTVSGYNRDESFDNIHSISWELNHLLFNKWMDKNEINFWHEYHVVPGMDTITIDGTDPDPATGTINFYVEGIKPDILQRILDNISDFLKQNGAKVGQMVREQSNMYNVPVIRIPIEENKKADVEDKPPYVQMSNGNAFFIFKTVLGFQQDLWQDGGFDAKQLRDRINYYEGETKLPEGSAQNINIDPQSLGDEEFLSGRSAASSYNETMVRERLAQIKELCDWALSHGYTKLFIG